MEEEKHVIIIFGDYVIDLFECETSNLGITVEKKPIHEDNPAVDIFVDKDDLTVHWG